MVVLQSGVWFKHFPFTVTEVLCYIVFFVVDVFQSQPEPKAFKAEKYT